MSVAITPLEDRPLLANLLQLYLYDFSEFAVVGTDHGEIGTDGLFGYEWLDLYWHEPGRIPVSFSVEGRIAGFALLNRYSALGRHIDHAMAEFFVLRKYRRHGIGARAAKQIFARWHGKWEVPVAVYNKPALAFWRAAIQGAIGQAAETVEGDGERWSGSVLCFDSRSEPARPDPIAARPGRR